MISYTYSITQDNSGLYMGSLLSPGSEDADPATIYQARFDLIEEIIRRIKRKEMPDIDIKKILN